MRNRSLVDPYGHFGEFRIETMETQAAGELRWYSDAFVYHRDHAAPVATLERAGEGNDRHEARAQALRFGRAYAKSLNPRDWGAG
ncbi:hypothetical protein XaCFBP7622_01290 [Xanthomonas arboricola]|nr:hypothetical protein XaCFBP7622_01290 [Xanthomonas arboricola]